MSLLDIILLVLVIMWVGGMSFGLAGNFIHIILVIALILLVLRLLRK